MTLKNQFAVAALATGFALSASAATINLTANNAGGSSGFNAATNWSVAAAPSAGNDYVTGGYLLRTPAVNGNFTFAGDSLSVTDGNGLSGFAAANNHALMWKGAGAGSIITVNNLIVDGGQIRHGSGDVDSFTLAGNISVGAKGAGFATQGPMYVTAPTSGTTSITIMDNGNGAAARTVYFQSAASTFTGNLILNHARARLTFNNGGVFNFVLGADGVNNSMSNLGTLTLDGLFKINTISADLTPGNDWNLVSGAGTEIYGSNFAIEGFTEVADVWTNGAGTLQFSELTGVLTALAPIPEPSAFAALAGVAGLGIAALRRRRRA